MNKARISKRKSHPWLHLVPLLLVPLVVCLVLASAADAVKPTQSDPTTVASHFKRKKPAAIKNRDAKAGDSVQQKILSTAFSQIGARYRYGGTSPETGFDCAGFVKWAYGQNGIDLPRSSREQLSHGKSIPKSELRPGDIVVFSRRMGSARGTHAGIYVGNGKFIHSPRTGYTVRVDNAFDDHYGARFMGARRVITAPGSPQPDDTYTHTLLAAGEASQDKDGPVSPDEDAPVVKRKDTRSGRSQALVADEDSPRQRASRHTIRKGDTPARVAKAYGISTEDLLAANNMRRNVRLTVGKGLIIPDKGARRGAETELADSSSRSKTKVVAEADTSTSRSARSDASGSLPSLVYTVQSGDSVSAIAHRHGVSKQTVLDANKLPTRHTLQIGQKLTIPGAAAPVLVQYAPAPEPEPETTPPAAVPGTRLAGTTLYSVQGGDSVWSIARKFKVSEQAILDANNLGKRHTLSLGQQLTIPAAQVPTLTAAADTPPEPQTSAGSLTIDPASLPSETVEPATGTQPRSGWRVGADASEAPPLLVADVFSAPPAPASALADVSITLDQSNQPPAPTAASETQDAGSPPDAAAPALQVAATTPAEDIPPSTSEYTVVKGDTISAIAKKLGVTQKALFEANALTPKHVLQLGQKLVVPSQTPADQQPPALAAATTETAAPAPPAAPEQSAPTSVAADTTAPQEYAVQSGDSVWSIARKFGVSEQAMLEANKLPKKHVLQLGQKLIIPPRPQSAAEPAVPGRLNARVTPR